jgi:type II secretion system protein G
MKLFRKQEGFTLVELMVVVLIIGILVAIAIPVFNSAKRNAQVKACFANQRTIDGALNSYQAQYGVFPADATAVTDLVTSSYLKKAPQNPGDNAAYTVLNNTCNGCPGAAPNDHGAY